MSNEIVFEMVSAIFDEAITTYARCARWASLDENGEAYGDSVQIHYWTLKQMREEVDAFLSAVAFLRPLDVWPAIAADPGQFGHDLWLTRNGHGAGFWDGDWPEPAATVLTDLAKIMGERDLILTDGGELQYS